MKKLFHRLLYKCERLGLLQHFNFSLNVTNEKFKIPVVGGWGLNHLNNQEPWFDKLLADIGSHVTDKTFIDCGVNIGQTLLKVKNFNSTIRYIGFEPNIFCVYYTQKLIEANNITLASVFPVGISNNTTAARLFLNKNNPIDTNASMIEGFRKGKFKDVMSLFLKPDDLNIWQERIGCIKIDVEGGELEVINGFKELIKRDLPYIICEILPVYEKSNIFRQKRQDELLQLLNDWGYSLYRISVEDGKLEKLETIELHSNLENSNYLFAPKAVR